MLLGQLVTLAAAGSEDANGDSITYSRRFQSNPIGSTATLANATSVGPTFTTDFAGFYVLSLIVKDGQISSVLDTVVIEARLPGFMNAVLQAYVKASNTQESDLFGFRAHSTAILWAVRADSEASCATGINGDKRIMVAFVPEPFTSSRGRTASGTSKPIQGLQH